MQTESAAGKAGHTAGKIDLGYSWIWTYGHLVLGVPFLAAAALAFVLGAPDWIFALLLVPVVWALIGFFRQRILVNMNNVGKLPAVRFLASGSGRVLDMGCGSGRMSIIVARERPQATIIALDNFSAKYIEGHGEEKLARNIQVAGVSDRVKIEKGNMLELPLADGEFDAVVSSHAIDHLGEKAADAISEAARVLQPDGEFLLIVSVPGLLMAITFGPLFLMGWGRMRSKEAWTDMLNSAGFTVTEDGSARGSAWFLAKRG